MSGFKTYSQEDFTKTLQDRDKRSLPFITGGVESYYPKQGENAIRLLPTLADDPTPDDVFGLRIRQYYIAGTYLVNPNLFGRCKLDPIIGRYNALKAEGKTDTPDGQKKYAPLRGSARMLIWVLDINDEKNAMIPKIWCPPIGDVEEITKISKVRATGELLRLNDPELGRVISFSKEGEGIATKMRGFAVDNEAMPITEDLIEHMKPFPDIVDVPSYEDCLAAVESLINADSSEAMDPTAPFVPPTANGDPTQSYSPPPQPNGAHYEAAGADETADKMERIRSKFRNAEQPTS